jgi:phage tail-like protein
VKREAIVERLPDIFKQAVTDDPANPLTALLGVMEELHARDEDILASFGRYIDPRRAPDEFVSYLAFWVDYAWLFMDPPDNPYAAVEQPFPGGLGRLRELVASAAAESKWRGTSAGMVRMLERATGVQGYRVEEIVTDESGEQLPFRIRVVVPSHAEHFLDLVRRIVEHEKPAHVIGTVDLEDAGT